jgi:hypothetical protein
MTIDLTNLMENHRFTRVVCGKHPSMDISEIFETHQKDFLTDEEITHENFDDDDVYFIQELGYTRRVSLLKVGVTKIVNIDNIYADIHKENLQEENKTKRIWGERTLSLSDEQNIQTMERINRRRVCLYIGRFVQEGAKSEVIIDALVKKHGESILYGMTREEVIGIVEEDVKRIKDYKRFINRFKRSLEKIRREHIKSMIDLIKGGPSD